ncbi:hypothetical protein [Hydrogenophaga sp. 2FB]|uniref:hypothetical protein n=1 Tax=Hydrogenophaga sp. 2FB TaxID=2502187 RepID=UPI0010F9FD38|nr:hypothetical protein [Hydrogenophaga sp. 2FB]
MSNLASPAYAAPPVIRSYALSVNAFDHLKAMQREYERREGVRMTNSAALERILKDHERATFGH